MRSALAWIGGAAISVAVFAFLSVPVFGIGDPTYSRGLASQITAAVGAILAAVACIGYLLAVRAFRPIINWWSALLRGVVSLAVTLWAVYAVAISISGATSILIALLIAFVVGAVSSMARRHAV